MLNESDRPGSSPDDSPSDLLAWLPAAQPRHGGRLAAEGQFS
jgi:hypothetical protein